jgi:hypothetical protein
MKFKEEFLRASKKVIRSPRRAAERQDRNLVQRVGKPRCFVV